MTEENKEEERRLAAEKRQELRHEHPFEATVRPEVLDSGRQWITVQLKNVSTDRLARVSATLWLLNPYDLDVLAGGSHYFVKELAPEETTDLNFHVFAEHTGWVYLHVTAWRDGDKTRHIIRHRVSWYSPYYEVRVNEDAAEIQSFFVDRPYWAYDETIETETVVHAYRDVGGLWVEIAATSPSKAYTTVDSIDIEFLAEGGTKRLVNKLHASEEGMWHLAARLFHEHTLISSKLTSCYVKPLEE